MLPWSAKSRIAPASCLPGVLRYQTRAGNRRTGAVGTLESPLGCAKAARGQNGPPRPSKRRRCAPRATKRCSCGVHITPSNPLDLGGAARGLLGPGMAISIVPHGAYRTSVPEHDTHWQHTQVGRATAPPPRAQTGCYSPCAGQLNSKQASRGREWERRIWTARSLSSNLHTKSQNR